MLLLFSNPRVGISLTLETGVSGQASANRRQAQRSRGSRFKAVNTRDKNYTPGAIRLRIEQVDASIARYLGSSTPPITKKIGSDTYLRPAHATISRSLRRT